MIMRRIYRIHMKSAARLMLSSIEAIQPLSVLTFKILEEEEDVFGSEFFWVLAKWPDGFVQRVATPISRLMARSHEAEEGDAG